jgi:transglutaminase-like putative cysteine protease
MKLAAGLALLILLAPIADAGTVVSDDWHAIFIEGAKVGHQHTRTEYEETVPAPGQPSERVWTTSTDMEVTVTRMGQPLRLRIRTRIVEGDDGRVLRFERHLELGGPPLKITGESEPAPDGKGGILRVVDQGRESRIPYARVAIGPAALARRREKLPLEEGAKLETRFFSPEYLGREVTTTVVMGKRETVDVLGTRVSLWRAEETVSAMPGVVSTTWVDRKRRPVLIELPFPGVGTMRVVLTSKEIALRPGRPAEVFKQTLVRPDRPIPDPRKGGRAVYRLSAGEERLPDLPGGGGQTVVRREDGSLEVTVNVGAVKPDKPFSLPVPKEAAGRFLEPAPLVESDDPLVLELAKAAVGAETDPVKAGRAIEAFVRRKISRKSLDVAFASAADTARSGEGDCTEHGVLCAALARAVGLPARVVIGLVYLPPGSEIGGETGIFGYHMWTEVMVGEDEWMAIDAAIGGMDRTHIAVARSDLVDVNPLVDLLLPLIGMMGNLRIEVVTTE